MFDLNKAFTAAEKMPEILEVCLVCNERGKLLVSRHRYGGSFYYRVGVDPSSASKLFLETELADWVDDHSDCTKQLAAMKNISLLCKIVDEEGLQSTVTQGANALRKDLDSTSLTRLTKGVDWLPPLDMFA